MNFKDLINYTERLQGNLLRKNGTSTYISVSNMDYFADKLSEVDKEESLLITPYLIIPGTLYELHYYEFLVAVREESSHYIEYNEQNALDKEITENLKPRANVADGDKDFYVSAVRSYLSAMKRMKFEPEKEYYPDLRKATLYYQIF